MQKVNKFNVKASVCDIFTFNFMHRDRLLMTFNLIYYFIIEFKKIAIKFYLLTIVSKVLLSLLTIAKLFHLIAFYIE